MNKKLNDYLELLEIENSSRILQIGNLEKFIKSHDHNGLMTIGRSCHDLDLEWKLMRNVLANIKAMIKEDEN